MAHSEICPVCQGEGKVRDKLSGEKKTCHGCDGDGWVEVQDDGGNTTTYIPYYLPAPTEPWSPFYTPWC